MRSGLNGVPCYLAHQVWMEHQDEQTAYHVPGNSYTFRHASVELLHCERTGDRSDKDQATRSLNWATYTVNEQGKNRYPYDDIGLTDGYGDYVRHYLRSMASAPELALDAQNHLLQCSSVLQRTQYSADQITYRKFDAQSVERLKLSSARPQTATGGTVNWDHEHKTLTIHAAANEVTILMQPNTAP